MGIVSASLHNVKVAYLSGVLKLAAVIEATLECSWWGFRSDWEQCASKEKSVEKMRMGAQWT
jgi:hypothetical protein